MLLTSRKHLALALLVAGIYAMCFSAIKYGLTFAPPLRFAALRSGGAGLTLLVFCAWSTRRVSLERRLWGGTAVLAILGTSLGYMAMFMSPGRTGAGLSSVLGNTGPLITILLAAAFLDERVTRAKALAVVLGSLGVSLIAWPALLDPTSAGPAGYLLPLTSAGAGAGATVLLKRLDAGDAVMRVAAWQLLLGTPPLALASVAFERQAVVTWTGGFVAALAFLSIAGTAFALALWYWLVQHEDVGRLTLILFLVPVIGLVAAVTIFKEQIGGVAAAGVAVTLAALAVVLISTRRDPTTDS